MRENRGRKRREEKKVNKRVSFTITRFIHANLWIALIRRPPCYHY